MASIFWLCLRSFHIAETDTSAVDGLSKFTELLILYFKVTSIFRTCVSKKWTLHLYETLTMAC